MTTAVAKDFEVYGYGLCYASVCSSLPQDEVEHRMAADYTGISSGWVLSSDAKFADGRPNPCPCDANPATHIHYLFNC